MKAFFEDLASQLFPDPRIKAQRNLARRNNWSFKHKSRMEEEAPELERFELFQGRRDKRIKAIMGMRSAKVLGRFRIYDFLYYGDLGKTQTTVFEFVFPSLDLFPFVIRPKSTMSAIKDFFVSEDSPFATTPEFQERYQITTENWSELKFDLNEDFLDCVGDVKGWTFEGDEEFLIAYQYGKTISTVDVNLQYQQFESTCERLINGRSSAEFV